MTTTAVASEVDRDTSLLSSNRVVRCIHGLDLDPIKLKLTDSEEGKGWTPEHAVAVEIQYKHFLVLNALYPDRHIVPTKEVDAFWHQHILDTQKYAEDCQEIFGYFLHHFPYFGMRGPEDAANLKSSFAETNALLQEHFGAETYDTASTCDSSACNAPPNCGSSCTGLGQ